LGEGPQTNHCRPVKLIFSIMNFLALRRDDPRGGLVRLHFSAQEERDSLIRHVEQCFLVMEHKDDSAGESELRLNREHGHECRNQSP
jgi:hypothetical protein